MNDSDYLLVLARDDDDDDDHLFCCFFFLLRVLPPQKEFWASTLSTLTRVRSTTTFALR